MIEAKLTTLLKRAIARVYPRLAPADATAPFAVYTRVSTTREATLGGPSGIAYATFRVDVYADRQIECLQIANEVRRQLDGHRDDEVLYCRLVNQLDLSELDSEDPLMRINLEFRISHFED